MIDSISTFIKTMDIGKISNCDEATLKQTIILRLFSLLGWDIFNPDEIKPEYTIGGKKVDYALCIESIPKVFVEVKRPNETLSNHQEQLLNYSFMQGIRLAILTNGITWWFYLPLQEASWEQRKYDSLEINPRNAQIFTDKIIKYLSKENVSTEKAIENATQAYRDSKRRRILDETFPKAWESVVNPFNSDFIDLLNSTIEEISGFRASATQLETYISKVLREKPIPKTKIIRPKTKTTRKQVIDEGSSNWIIPATYRESIEKLVAKEKMWAFGENTGGKTSLKIGDNVCFYLSGKGIVAHAKVTSEPKYELNEKVSNPEKYPWVFQLTDEEVYLDSPVPLNKEKRLKLDAFQGKETQSNWGWFVMGSHTITQNDFYELIRTN